MNKETEISILSKAAADLGTNSYLGPWLKSIISELERDLRSDFIPVITLAEARQQSEYILAAARNTAETHWNRVRDEADAVLERAEKDATRTRDRLIAQLLASAKELGR